MIDNCPTCFRPLPASADITVSLDENCVIWKGIRVDLSPNETVIMHVLKRGGHNWTHKERLMAALYGFGDPANDPVIGVYFSHIRRKLKDKGVPIEIESGGMGKFRLKY